jgi:pimeloyl-ACP methyl ester carboxylesterase
MFVQLNSTRFRNCFYQKIGHGKPVFLVHGFGEDATIFKHQTDDLQNSFELIIPDLPGSGTSQLCDEEMNMELLADFVFEIAAQENFQKIILLGHSMGGYLTMAFAQKFAHKLCAFGLIHSSAYEDDEAKKETRRKSIKLIENDGKEIFLKTMIPNLYSEESKLKYQVEMQEHLTMAINISSKALIAYCHAMINRPDSRQILAIAKVPVLFVVGKKDNAIPYMQMIEQVSMPAIAKVEILEKVGHTSMNESKKELNRIINNFCLYVLDKK